MKGAGYGDGGGEQFRRLCRVQGWGGYHIFFFFTTRTTLPTPLLRCKVPYVALKSDNFHFSFLSSAFRYGSMG